MTLVETRIDLLAAHRESLRRALALLALPPHVPFAVKLGWRSAACMSRPPGATATDSNHYSNRAILGAVYGATLAVYLNAESAGITGPRAFLGRAIDTPDEH